MFAHTVNKSALARTRKCGSNHDTSIQLANAGNRYLAHQQLDSAKVQGMNVPTSDPSIGPSAIPVTGADASPCKTVAVLQELLTQSIHLRDLYKNARWQFSGMEFRDLRQMLDDHYKAQLSVIDVLVDRIRNLGGAARVFAGDFLQRTAVLSCATRPYRHPSDCYTSFLRPMNQSWARLVRTVQTRIIIGCVI